MKLRKLPDGIRYMKNLRCLDNQGCHRLHYMPVGMKELTCLGRLAEFVVGKKKGAQITELGDLNLHGPTLKLTGLENVGSLEDAKSAKLKNKTKLVSLDLQWWGRFEKRDEEVVEGLEPNSSLKELEILGYMGTMICPSWMMNLGNLVKISFSFCKRCESIQSLGKLPSLRVIELENMDVLKCLGDDEFPSLRELEILKCNELVSLPSNLPKLEGLSLIGVRGLASLPSNLPNLERLEICGAHGLVCLPSNLPKLERFDIEWAKGLVSLPSNLPKLSELYIRGCPELNCMPDDLKELTSLTILECEKLKRRCEKETGEDWSKISHVPNIHLLTTPDGSEIRRRSFFFL